ncbi:Fmp27p KNAG_0D05290 [Huiozyma naganishii CBS 8797]|uniref:Protein FMP27, mitochondrial n=1 Tax=Huiozyma naganishii (strain ATCC MYA-139 / BCRC 22969 / CBS 8797 / KCTC 17520 / NBRC 10181 / NCYC 3082 / Yp74L-3) TaxID=1071383 RepID=J7RYM0_HUIN7|nr:hypothetical protein KNAG_0D05290 [Kazachstania naganishii CBS 8797]CCK70267.1 hypothetical protein KNAG_0D05290 [Kazachstania naganishii CBS 8797]
MWNPVHWPIWIWEVVAALAALKWLLKWTVGFDVTYINPMKAKIGFKYKNLLEVKDLQVIPLQKKIILSGVTVFANDKKKKVPTAGPSTTDGQKKLPQKKKLELPKWVSSKFGLLSFFLDDFRIAVNHLHVVDQQLKVSVVYFVLSLQDTEGKRFSVSLGIKDVEWRNESSCSDMYLTVRGHLPTDSPHPVDQVEVDLKLGKFSLSMEALHQLQQKQALGKTKPIKETRAPLDEKDIDKIVGSIVAKTALMADSVLPLKELNVTIEKLCLRDLAIAKHERLRCMNKFLSYSFSLSNLTFNVSRYRPGMPGYQLSFKEEDTPFKLTLNMTRVNISLNMTRKHNPSETVKFLEIPNISLFGETNLGSQKFKHDYFQTPENAVCNLRANVASPTMDINVEHLSFWKCFLKNIKVFTEAFTDPVQVTCGGNKDKFVMRSATFSYFKSFLPLVFVKLNLDDPKIVFKDNDDLIMVKLSTFLVNWHSKRFFREKMNSLKYEEELCYESKIYLEVLDLRFQHIVKTDNYKNTIFRIDSISSLHHLKLEPSTIVAVSGDIDNLTIDLSELRTMVMLSKMIRKLDCQISNVEKNYFKPLYEKFAAQISNSEQQCDLISKTFEEEKVLPSTFLFEKLPDCFDYVKFDVRKFTMLLGARSVFMPPDVFSSIESQSSHDLVDGKLRKFCTKMDQLQIALFGNYTQWKNKYDDGKVNMVKHGEEASYKGYFHDGLDDISSTESTEIGFIWSFNVLANDVTCTVIGETPDSTNELTSRTVSKLSVLSLNVYPDTDTLEINDSKMIRVQFNNKKVKNVFSLMNTFLVISGIHTLHQIFGKCQQTEQVSWAKQYLMKINKSKKKSSVKLIQWSELKSLIDVSFLSETFDEIMSLPNGLKTRVESHNTLFTVRSLKDIVISGDFFRTCIQSPTDPSLWERFVVINKFSITADLDELKAQKTANYADLIKAKPAIILENESWHFSVPFKFELHRLIDNFSTVLKTIKQMMYSFKTSKNDLVIFPSVTHSSGFPRLKLKSKRYILSIADDPFEAQMNMIFQIGLQEQRSRLAKLKEFDDMMMTKLSASKEVINKRKETVSQILNRKRLDPDFEKKYKPSPENDTGALIDTPFNIGGKSNKKTRLVDLVSDEVERTYERLERNFSDSWVKRIQNFRLKERQQFQENFSFLWGNIDYSILPPDVNEKVTGFTTYPSVSSLIMEGIDVDIFKPSCGVENIPEFIHNVGKGVPKDTQYSIMIPMNIDAKFSEIRWHLRDYPLPFINVPALQPSQTREDCALRIYGDMIVCEDMITSDHELRCVYVPLVPSIIVENTDEYYSLKVPRTVTSIKFYIDLNLDSFSNNSSQITMGSSFQPAIQQTMQCIENISKPPLDPSQKTGFWDKVRYLFHGHLKVSWKNQGRFEVAFKGSKSPYVLGRENAGFILGFGGDVVLSVNENEDPKKFLSCTANEIYFSIPNFFAKPLLVWSRPSSEAVFAANQNDTNLQRSASYYYMADFVKTKSQTADIQTMESNYIEKTGVKLTGGMEFSLGFIFERMVLGKDMHMGERTFASAHHYDIRLTNPIYVPDLSKHDSYAGFRSDFIHMSFNLVSKSDSAYNAMQLGPGTMDVFMKWWKTFSGNFPVRRGKLFSIQNNAPKFGEHLATISYHADARPLFITHLVHSINTDKNVDKCYLDFVEFVGTKTKTKRFTMDLHQRKELVTEYNPELDIRKRVKKMKFLEGEVEMDDIDIRTIHGKFGKLAYVEQKEDAHYDIFDNDLTWLDLTDFQEPFFVDVDKYLPSVEIKPFFHAPNFIYQKRSSYGDKFQLDPVTYQPTTPFLNNVSHNCVLGREVQVPTKVLEDRLKNLTSFQTQLTNDYLKTEDPSKKKLLNYLLEKAKVGLDSLDLLHDDVSALCYERSESTNDRRVYSIPGVQILDRSTVSTKEFENRFFIFNMLLKWNEDIRDIIMKFLHYLSLASKFSSLSSQKSLKIFEEMMKHRIMNEKKMDMETINEEQEPIDLQMGSGNKFGNKTDDLMHLSEICLDLFENGITTVEADIEYLVHKNTFLQLVAPQVQLSMREEPDMCVIVTAPNIITKNLSFEQVGMEDHDDQFLKRFGVIVNNANAFLLRKADFKNKYELYFDMNSYGQKKGTEWPPWLGIEQGFQSKSLDDFKILKDLSCVIHSQTVSPFSNSYHLVKTYIQDKMIVHVPTVAVTATSRDFGTMYKMVNKLLKYQEPAKVKLNKEIETMSIAYDVDNIPKLHQLVSTLYKDFGILNNVSKELLFKRQLLDDVGRVDLLNVYAESESHLLRLHMLMRVLESNSIWQKASTGGSESSGSRSKMLVCNVNKVLLSFLMNDYTPFLSVSLARTIFQRAKLSSGLSRNKLVIGELSVVNELPDAVYKTVFSGFPTSVSQAGSLRPMMDFQWEIDEPVGGIKVLNFAETLLSGACLQIDDDTIDCVMQWLNLKEVRSDDGDGTTTVVAGAGTDRDLNEMVQRASEYMIVERMVLNAFPLLVSYKGHGKKRLGNVTNFAFDFPELLFANETMKLLDIYMVVRKVLVKVLLKHTARFLTTKIRKRRSTIDSRSTAPAMLPAPRSSGAGSLDSAGTSPEARDAAQDAADGASTAQRLALVADESRGAVLVRRRNST